MKKKQFLNAILASMVTLMMYSTVHAQTIPADVPCFPDSDPCTLCAPHIGSIGISNLPNCLYKGFSANTGGYGRCQQIEVIWATNDNSATFPYGSGGNGFCLIQFSAPGVWQVCAKVRYGIDLDNDGRIEENEICTSPQFCTWVTVTCP